MKKNVFWFTIALILVLFVNAAVFVLERNIRNNHPAVLAETTPPQLTRKVLAFVIDPTLSGGQKLSDNQGWRESSQILSDLPDFFRSASSHFLNYDIYGTTAINYFYPFQDTFTYTDNQYFDCLNNASLCHAPEQISFDRLITDFNLCGRMNSGDFNEVWIIGGDHFGLNESRLVGKNGFWYNSTSYYSASCNKLLPVMGIRADLAWEDELESFVHRMEVTMTAVYGSWQQNSIAHNWNYFGLVKALSSSFFYSGCGKADYAPNSSAPGTFAITDNVFSSCYDFADYPHLFTPGTVLTRVNCIDWGCSKSGFYNWWFRNIPLSRGYNDDGRLNNWWEYFSDPNVVLSNMPNTTWPPASPTPTPTPLPVTPSVTPSPTPEFSPTPGLSLTPTPEISGVPAETITPEPTYNFPAEIVRSESTLSSRWQQYPIDEAFSVSIASNKNGNKIDSVNKKITGLVLSGTAEPLAAVQLYIYSTEPVFVTTAADSEGTWKAVLDNYLGTGTHHIYAIYLGHADTFRPASSLSFSIEPDTYKLTVLSGGGSWLNANAAIFIIVILILLVLIIFIIMAIKKIRNLNTQYENTSVPAQAPPETAPAAPSVVVPA
jgi:hypothetical protein